MSAGNPENATLLERASRTAELVRGVADVIAGRVTDGRVPDWCERRGWTDFLLRLGDAELVRCETQGLARALPELAGAPRDLSELGAAVRSATDFPAVSAPLLRPTREQLRAVSFRKGEQLSALLGAVQAMAERAARVVDVGAGSGHFTRLSAEVLGRSSLGVERNERLVAKARARGEGQPSGARYEAASVGAGAGAFELEPGDLAVGLHACGELGDTLIRAAARAGCRAVLVSCCLQKRAAAFREPLSRAAASLRIQRETLGLANLSAGASGVEAATSANVRARETRLALLRLLESRGFVVEAGEEMRGLNRRRAQLGLRAVAEPALALRGLQPATEAELRHHEAAAAREHALVRRFTLPRNMLGRLVEVAVVLDRGAALSEAGLEAAVRLLSSDAVTPRNLALFASAEARELP